MTINDFRKKSFILILITSLILFSNNLLISQEDDETSFPIVNENGITFQYHNNHAKKVFLKSSFDHWKLKYPFSKKITGRGLWDGWWELKLPIQYKEFQLKKGSYTYKFLVDDEFVTDPLNSNKKEDEMGNQISYFVLENDLINYNINNNPIKVLDKKYYYRFIFKSYSAKYIYIVGNFNHWNTYSHSLKYIGNGTWEIILRLTPGKYYYNFIVDNKWIKDPLNTQLVRNVLGIPYSFFEVKE